MYLPTFQIAKLESKIKEHTDNKEFRESVESEKLNLETEKDDLLKQVKEYEEKYAKLEEECKWIIVQLG